MATASTIPPPFYSHSFSHSSSSFFFFFLALLSVVSAPLLSSAAKPGYQLFYPNGGHRTENAASSISISSSTATDSPSLHTWKAEISHRDQIHTTSSSSSSSSSHPFAIAASGRLSRDAARVAALTKRLQIAVMGENPSEWKPSLQEDQTDGAMEQKLSSSFDFTSPIVSGLSQGSGEYFTRFGLGTPPRFSYFVMDTGSDLSWTQCQPCQRCYNQSDPYFNPSASSSYQSVGCGASLCSQLLVKGCQANMCLYQVSYGDGSFTVGDFALEKFTFGKGTVVLKVAIGCGHDNEGLFQGAAGLLGLGNGKLSFPTQTKTQFSYCLADRFQGGSSELIFGRGAAPRGSVFTPMLKNPKLSTFYYVGLDGISVGGQLLQIPRSVFALQSDGSGGVIVDSGTSITRLTAPAYVALRDAFVAATSDLPSAGSVSLFDTCYALGGMTSVSVPTVDFHYAGQAVTKLPAANYLIPVDTTGTFCFAFAGTNAAFSIIGNMQQQGYRVSFNSAAARVGFAPNQC